MTRSSLGSEREASFHVLGLDCPRCARHAEEALQGTLGAISAKVYYEGELAQVTYDPQRTSEAELVEVMGRAGYRVSRVAGLAPSTRAGTGLLRVLLAVVLLLGQLALSAFDVGPPLLRAALATALLVIAGAPPARRALRRARDGSLGHDALVVVAALIVFALGWAGLHGGAELASWRGFDSSSVIVVFALVERAVYAALWAHTLDDLAREERARLSAAFRVDPAGNVKTVTRDALRAGDRVRLPAGCLAPADVRLESEARIVEPGATAGAEIAPHPLGAVVRSGSLVLDEAMARVTRPSCSPITSMLDAETHRVLAGVLRERGLSSSSGVGEVVGQATIVAAAAFAFFAFAVRVGAGASYLSPAPWFFAVAVLAAASPAPFALALALARAAIVVRARALGVVIRDPAALGPLAGVTVACFDKTGTVTTADLRVAGVIWRDGVEAEGVLADVLAVESASKHPSGRAIVSYLRASGVSSAMLDGEVLEGRGVISGQVHGARVTIGASRALASAGAPEAPLGASVAWFVERGIRQGYFVLIDTLREGVGAVFRSLWQRSVPCRILSGDRREATRALAHRLGVPGLGGLGLVDKALVVRDLQHGGARVLFVGRGEGGASPCPHADVAITVSDTLPRSSDPAPIVLTEERLDALPWLIDSARALRRTTRWVFGIGVAFNALLIPAAVVGLLHPIAAASLALVEGLLTMGIAAVRIFRPAVPVEQPRQQSAAG